MPVDSRLAKHVDMMTIPRDDMKGHLNRSIQALREEHKAGRLPRYIVRCGLEPSGRVQVHDCAGGWVCSTHATLALAQTRADERNKVENRTHGKSADPIS